MQGALDVSVVYTPTNGWWGIPWRGGGFAGGVAEFVDAILPTVRGVSFDQSKTLLKSFR